METLYSIFSTYTLHMLLIEVVQLVLAVLLVASILMQSKGAGLSQVLGGGTGNIYSTKRGVEKSLFYFTIIVAILFFGSHIFVLIRP